ncbi:DDE-type integrase/transposase/recombinase [Streptomyces sp. NPDC088788]|uniref:DDE-type integrase/transposase/recombinase n=1 Tax=Streptomyces sp. NPDC088788 TaxID=3365898 RepID=UPI0038042721
MNTKYVGDIAYLPASGAKPLCLATVIDLASPRLSGWVIADHMRTELVIDALTAAGRTRGSLEGAIMHTDHGPPYTSPAFAETCRSAGVRQKWARSGPAPTMPLLSPSTLPSEGRCSKAGRPGRASARPGPTPSDGSPRYNTHSHHSHLGQRSPIAYKNDLQPAPTTDLRRAT